MGMPKSLEQRCRELLSRQSPMQTFLSRTQRSVPFVTRQKRLRGRLVGDHQHVRMIGNVVLAENFGVQWNPFCLGLPCIPSDCRSFS